MTKKPNLREWLKRTGTTTIVLSQKSGISRQTISYILNGRSEANFETATAIWKATGYEVRLISLYPEYRKLCGAIRKIKCNEGGRDEKG